MARSLLCLAASFFLSVAAAVPTHGADRRSVPDFRSSVYDWQGVYGGVVAALDSFETRLQGLNTDPDSVRGDGELAGIVLGYNLKRRGLVLGGEADLSFGEIKATSRSAGIEADFLASLRARIGIRYERMLPFVSAGLVFAGVNATSPMFASGRTLTRTGATAGAGVEYAIAPSLSGRVEYLYARLLDGTLPGLDDIHMYRAALIVNITD